MATDPAETGSEYLIELNYNSDAFTVRREPVRDLIQSFSSLYLEPEPEADEVKEVEDSGLLPLPPPPEDEDESLISLVLANRVKYLETRMSEVEGNLSARFDMFETQVLDNLNTHQNQISSLEVQVKAYERSFNQRDEAIVTEAKNECQRIKQVLEESIQDLGRAVMDCLKRRDATSTPARHSTPLPEIYSRSIQFKSPIKLDFPKFSSLDGEDPIAYLEKCEEYLAIQPLSNAEILSMLPSVLTHTAKDWWIAEKARVKSWTQFKTVFLQSFLPEDHEVEAERRIRERKQAVDENIRSFVYQYRALCLRLKPAMTEREILQAILRNCNPRIASILRGTVSTIEELVRVGTLVERDLNEERVFWRQRQAEHATLRGGGKPGRGRPNSHSIAVYTEVYQPPMTTLTLPLNIRNHHLEAIIDTGSSYSLIQESLWDQIKQEGETLQSSKGQTFSLANGHIQHALGKVSLQCVVHNQVYPFRVFVMRNHDLTFPLIIGLEFLSILA